LKIFRINPVLLLLIFFAIVSILTNGHQKEKKIVSPVVKRIVSLSPSLTAEVIDLESENLLVGVTSYHPPLSQKIDIVGTYVRPNLEKIILLKPDVVLFSNEDNSVQMTEMLNATGIRTEVFKRNENFNAICNNYLKLGQIIGKKDLAEKKIRLYKSQNTRFKTDKNFTVAFFLSIKPFIGASNNSYIGRIIEESGAKNILGTIDSPYPVVSVEHLVTLNPDIFITTSRNYKEELKSIITDFPELGFVKNNSIYLVKSDLVCYYTPQNYINSAVKFRKILKLEKNKHEQKN